MEDKRIEHLKMAIHRLERAKEIITAHPDIILTSGINDAVEQINEIKKLQKNAGRFFEKVIK